MTFNSVELRRVRQQKNLSIRELAEIAGVSKSQISDLENGQLHNTTIDTICKLAMTLEVNPASLFSC